MNRNGRPKKLTTEERFWEKVTKGPECWTWVGGTVGSKGAHGRFAVTSTRADVRLVLPHRYSWELHFGAIPDGLNVLHACDNGACVRPAHLMLGTQHANMVDARQKGRWPRLSRG